MARTDRIDTANCLIHASSDDVYQAFIDLEAWLQWLPPDWMSGETTTFDARKRGTFELTLT